MDEVIKYVDAETGALYETASEAKAVVEARQAQKMQEKNSHFVQLALNVAPNLLSKITKSGLQVLGYFLDNMNMQDVNTIIVSQSVIAKELGVTRQTIANGIKSLEELKIVAVGKVGQANVYLINPKFAWMNGYQKRETMRLQATVLLGKEENENIFKEFDKIEQKSLRTNIKSSRIKVKTNN